MTFTAPTDHQLDTILRETFGFDSFRSGQREAITTLFTERSLLCIQPTGHGKSLLYQLPTKILPGITLVISPLLALMRDQEKHLNSRFGISAAAINSDQDEEHNAQVRAAAASGNLKVLFVAPEQLDHVDRFNFLVNLPISLVVIDEAHCISTWGHDFRPSYRQILNLVRALTERHPALHILAITATANDKTEQDIIQQLSLTGRALPVHRTSMDRPNISLSAITARGNAMKLALLEQLIPQLPHGGLLYCATRDNTELVADHLVSSGISAVAYHAGKPPETKRQLQQDFLGNKYSVLCATNALGMGIDKSNLRYIIHFDVPGSITAYYQEVGRCGRDGQPAQGILLYDPADKRIQEHFINSAQPTIEDFQGILRCIDVAEEPPGLVKIKQLTGLHPTRVTVIIAELVEQGFLEKVSSSGRQVYCRTDKAGGPLLDRYKIQREIRFRELHDMLSYAEKQQGCKMAILRSTLGDTNPQPCGRCDLCKPTALAVTNDASRVESISSWLSERPVPIPKIVRLQTLEGVAMLDSKLRSPLFVHFMKQRGKSSPHDTGITDELFTILHKQLDILAQANHFGCVVTIPSRTWGARDTIANHIATILKVPLLSSLLFWKEVPPARQGELLNNDQRRENVTNRMTLSAPYTVPPGTILLFDDYFGSAATLREASQTLRTEGRLRNPILPFTIAAVQWRLGKSGMI